MKKIRLIDLIDVGILFVISIVLLGIFICNYMLDEEGNGIEPTIIVDLSKYPPLAKQTVEITTAGDCTLGSDTNFGYNGQFDWWFKNKADSNYGYFFDKVRYLFENDDYSYVNLEGTLTTYNKKNEKTFNFKGDPSYVNILLSGNIEGVNLANNHSNDYGVIGYNDTKKYLKEANIDYFGYDDILIKEIKGKKIAFVGYTSVGLWTSKIDDFKNAIKKLKEEEKVSVVIANFHWGIEYSHTMSDVERKWAHIAIDSGADIVIGSHPHCLQGMEVYNGKYIVYSLGNFVFGGNSSPRDIAYECIVVKMFFDFVDDELVNIRIKVIPCNISSSKSRNNYQPIVVHGKDKEKLINRINKYSINYKYNEGDFYG